MEFIKTNFIDFIVVACFFSNHYHNADNCFARIENERTRESMSFLNGKTCGSFVKDFVDGIKLNKCPHHSKKYKFRDIEYLWALYLDKHHIHHDIIKHTYHNNLRNLTDNKKKEFIHIDSEILKTSTFSRNFGMQLLIMIMRLIMTLAKLKTCLNCGDISEKRREER